MSLLSGSNNGSIMYSRYRWLSWTLSRGLFDSLISALTSLVILIQSDTWKNINSLKHFSVFGSNRESQTCCKSTSHECLCLTMRQFSIHFPPHKIKPELSRNKRRAGWPVLEQAYQLEWLLSLSAWKEDTASSWPGKQNAPARDEHETLCARLAICRVRFRECWHIFIAPTRSMHRYIW